MSEMEITIDVKTEEFTDELSDEALDREHGEGKICTACSCGDMCVPHRR